MYRLLLSLRYLVSRPINLLGIAGMALGVWALVVVPSIFTGYLREVGKHLQSSTADLTIRRLPRQVSAERLLAVIDADPAVQGCAPRVVWQGMLHPPEPPQRSRPPARGLDELVADAPLVTLLGIDPDRERAITGLEQWLRRPPPELQVREPSRPLAARGDDDRPALILSRQRLERDGFRVGGRAAITAARLEQREDGGDALAPRSPTQFTIAGCYESSFAAFDGLNVFVDAADLARVLGDGAADAATAVPPTEIAVRLRDGADADAVGRRLERSLRAEFGSYVLATTWAQANRVQLEAVSHQRGLLQMVLWVIMLVAGFVVYATQSMMVTEKTRDIGVLTALGADARGVATLFVSCGAATALSGVVLGIATGIVSAMFLDDFNTLLRESPLEIDLFPVRIYNLRHVPYAIEPWWLATVALIATALGVAAAGLPAWRAARHDPLATLRHE